ESERSPIDPGEPRYLRNVRGLGYRFDGGGLGFTNGLFTAETQRRRDAETSAEILGTDGPVVEGDGQAREWDFDAEARRRGGKRGETAQSKRGRARRQRRMVAFGVERTGFRRDPRHVRRKPGA